MTVLDALLDSWRRQARIVNKVAGLIDESNKHLRPSPDSWPIYQQLAHMHSTRRYFLGQFNLERQVELAVLFQQWDTPATEDMGVIRAALEASGEAVAEVVGAALEQGVAKSGWYDNPVLYLQHMVWHEGWHVGMILLALRVAGQEVPEEWEEPNIWGEWRTEEW